MSKFVPVSPGMLEDLDEKWKSDIPSPEKSTLLRTRINDNCIALLKQINDKKNIYLQKVDESETQLRKISQIMIICERLKAKIMNFLVCLKETQVLKEEIDGLSIDSAQWRRKNPIYKAHVAKCKNLIRASSVPDLDIPKIPNVERDLSDLVIKLEKYNGIKNSQSDHVTDLKSIELHLKLLSKYIQTNCENPSYDPKGPKGIISLIDKMKNMPDIKIKTINEINETKRRIEKLNDSIGKPGEHYEIMIEKINRCIKNIEEGKEKSISFPCLSFFSEPNELKTRIDVIKEKYKREYLTKRDWNKEKILSYVAIDLKNEIPYFEGLRRRKIEESRDLRSQIYDLEYILETLIEKRESFSGSFPEQIIALSDDPNVKWYLTKLRFNDLLIIGKSPYEEHRISNCNEIVKKYDLHGKRGLRKH
jgi:hypothetical protein